MGRDHIWAIGIQIEPVEKIIEQDARAGHNHPAAKTAEALGGGNGIAFRIDDVEVGRTLTHPCIAGLDIADIHRGGIARTTNAGRFCGIDQGPPRLAIFRRE